MSEERIILPSDPEAASLKTVTGWVSRHGLFFGNDEQAARYHGSTHYVCQRCGQHSRKSHLRCDSCADSARDQMWAERPRVVWDGEEAIYADSIGRYFFDEDDLRDFFEEEDITTVDAANALRLYRCRPGQFTEINPEDIWDDLVPDDGALQLPGALDKAIKALNRTIQRHQYETSMWFPSNDAIDVQDLLRRLNIQGANDAESDTAQ